MTQLCIDTDVLAFTIHGYLASADYALAAAQAGADLDYTTALNSLVAARTLASAVLSENRNERSNDHERFVAFNKEAIKKLDSFWAIFRLVIKLHPNGSSSLVATRHIEHHSNVKVHGSRPHVPDKTRELINRDIASGKPEGVGVVEWQKLIAETYHVSLHTVQNEYYRKD